MSWTNEACLALDLNDMPLLMDARKRWKENEPKRDSKKRQWLNSMMSQLRDVQWSWKKSYSNTYCWNVESRKIALQTVKRGGYRYLIQFRIHECQNYSFSSSNSRADTKLETELSSNLASDLSFGSKSTLPEPSSFPWAGRVVCEAFWREAEQTTQQIGNSMNWICFVAAEETFIQGPRHQLVDIRHTWGVFFNTLQQTFLQASFRGRKLKYFCPKITRNQLSGQSFLSLALGAIISKKNIHSLFKCDLGGLQFNCTKF